MKKISVFSGEGTELTGKDHYGMQSYCGEKGCSVHVDNETPCQGCVNGKVTVLRSILSGKTYVSCHGDAEFECQANDGCIGTEWYGDVVNVANDLEMGGEERTFGDAIKESNDLEIDGKEMTLGDTVKEANDLEIEGEEKTLDDVLKEANVLDFGGEERNLGDVVVSNITHDGEERASSSNDCIKFIQDNCGMGRSSVNMNSVDGQCETINGEMHCYKWNWCNNKDWDCGCTVTCATGNVGKTCVGKCSSRCCSDTRATYEKRISCDDDFTCMFGRGCDATFCHNNNPIIGKGMNRLCCPNCAGSNCPDCPNTCTGPRNSDRRIQMMEQNCINSISCGTSDTVTTGRPRPTQSPSSQQDCVKFVRDRCKVDDDDRCSEYDDGTSTRDNQDGILYCYKWNWCRNKGDCGCEVECTGGPYKGEKCVGKCTTACCPDTEELYKRRFAGRRSCRKKSYANFPYCHNNDPLALTQSITDICCPNCAGSNCPDCPNTCSGPRKSTAPSIHDKCLQKVITCGISTDTG